MSPYATATLENLRDKRNRSPDETALLITLTAQSAADAAGVSPAGLMLRRPPVPATRPADEFDESDWDLRACHAHAF